MSNQAIIEFQEKEYAKKIRKLAGKVDLNCLFDRLEYQRVVYMYVLLYLCALF